MFLSLLRSLHHELPYVGLPSWFGIGALWQPIGLCICHITATSHLFCMDSLFDHLSSFSPPLTLAVAEVVQEMYQSKAKMPKRIVWHIVFAVRGHA